MFSNAVIDELERNLTFMHMSFNTLLSSSYTHPKCIGHHSKPIKRICIYIESILHDYGLVVFQKAYCMSKDCFNLLLDKISQSTYKSRFTTPNKARGCRNEIIDKSVLLSVALCVMAGGRPYDIAISHGIGLSEVYNCLWVVVDVINEIPQLEIKYPTSYESQRQIAKEFQEKSAAKSDCCVGAINGMLIWTEQPHEKETARMICGV